MTFFPKSFCYSFSGNPFERCYPTLTSKCNCKTLNLSSPNPDALYQNDKLGIYHLYGEVNYKPAYQHETGNDFIYFSDFNQWFIGPDLGGRAAGIRNEEISDCPYLFRKPWDYNVRGELIQDDEMRLQCLDK